MHNDIVLYYEFKDYHMLNQQSSLGREENQEMESQNLKGNEEDSVSKLTIAWWRILHVSTEIISQQWVE